MTCSGSGKFTCNVCGAACELSGGSLGREAAHCTACGSSMRVRALVALLAQEIFGLPLALPEFPALKGLRGVGMSDTPELASRLAEKFDYTNTFYHQPPVLDVTRPDENDFGRYDFILSSEVMEHVPPPVEQAFANLARLLKPHGVLLMTTPYTVSGKTAEHFPELHEYTLASPGGRTMLVNRRRDGRVEVFEDLMFHGGPGSTLEIRVFSEDSLRETLAGAGFPFVRIASEDAPEFGIVHAETWSLPIAARKQTAATPPAELAGEYREASRRAARLQRELETLESEYRRYIEFHDRSHQELERDLEARTQWARKLEAENQERTQWALDLQREKHEAIQNYEQARKSELEGWGAVNALEQELEQTRARLAQVEARLWTRMGRRLRALK